MKIIIPALIVSAIIVFAPVLGEWYVNDTCHGNFTIASYGGSGSTGEHLSIGSYLFYSARKCLDGRVGDDSSPIVVRYFTASTTPPTESENIESKIYREMNESADKIGCNIVVQMGSCCGLPQECVSSGKTYVWSDWSATSTTAHWIETIESKFCSPYYEKLDLPVRCVKYFNL